MRINDRLLQKGNLNSSKLRRHFYKFPLPYIGIADQLNSPLCDDVRHPHLFRHRHQKILDLVRVAWPSMLAVGRLTVRRLPARSRPISRMIRWTCLRLTVRL